MAAGKHFYRTKILSKVSKDRRRGKGSAMMICASGSVTASQTTPTTITSGGRGKMTKMHRGHLS